MHKKIFILAFLLLFYACERDETDEPDLPEDPCSLLVDGVYPYPSEPPGSNLTDAEKLEYWNIPEDILPCLTTEGLLETCLSYPDLGSHMLTGGTDDHSTIKQCRRYRNTIAGDVNEG